MTFEIQDDRVIKYWDCAVCKKRHSNVNGAVLLNGNARGAVLGDTRA